jgi:nicotinamide phosphoribosyltransferase
MLQLIKPFNFILACDSYKTGHYLELPEGTLRSYAAIVPRKPSKYATKIVAMGQTYVANFLASVRITQEMIEEADIEITQQGYEFNRADWQYMVDELEGKLPLEVWAVEEGRIVKPQTPVLGIVNTHDRFAWLPTYVETVVQCTVWKMSTVASTCRAARIIIAKYMQKTGANMAMLNYKLHNFGDRGADSPDEAAVIAGIAHAALFDGSDCTRANGYIKALFNSTKAYTSSVEATEHSVMCAHSDADKRDDFGAAKMAVKRLHAVVARTKRGIGIPLLSVVIDTYNARRFVREYMGETFREEIKNSGGVMVMRPDSGDATVEPALVAKDVEDTFGATENSAGYKVLAPCTAVIQGDGIRINTIEPVLEGFTGKGYSMDSLTLGMGAGVTHEGARDDFSFSMKAIAMMDANGWRSLVKEPITDLGKKSLRGLVRPFELESGELEVHDCTDNPASFFVDGPGWRLWSKDGERIRFQDFDEVQTRARADTTYA